MKMPVRISGKLIEFSKSTSSGFEMIARPLVVPSASWDITSYCSLVLFIISTSRRYTIFVSWIIIMLGLSFFNISLKYPCLPLLLCPLIFQLVTIIYNFFDGCWNTSDRGITLPKFTNISPTACIVSFKVHLPLFLPPFQYHSFPGFGFLVTLVDPFESMRCWLSSPYIFGMYLYIIVFVFAE